MEHLIPKEDAPPGAVQMQVCETDAQLAACFQIRMTVFVAEQNVPPELEMDAYDSTAIHYLALIDGAPVATARALDKSGLAKIGRVAVLRQFRGQGIGAALMNFIHEDLERRGFQTLILEAQTYAIGFYEKLGYEAHGGEFLDAGIPHRHMTRIAGQSI
jgi:predicted GNAT family N-acyltransferase